MVIKMMIRDVVDRNFYEDLSEIAKRPFWNDVQQKNFLITGGAGFIAYYLCLSILLRNDIAGNGNTVWLLIRNPEKAKKRYGNILEREDVRLLVQDACTPIETFACDYIIHAAGGAEAYLFEKQPVDVFMTNSVGTQEVLSFANRVKAKSVVYLSSYTVYGEGADRIERVGESFTGTLDWTKYNACYANGKRAGEMLCACHHHQFQTPVKILRPGFIFGASGLNDSRVYAEIIRKVMQKENVLLKSSGLVYRSVCYVTDLVRAILVVLFGGEDGAAYNAATEHISILDYANCATQAYPEDNLRVVFANPEDAGKEKPAHIMGKMDCDKLRSLSPAWDPQVSVTDGIRMACEILTYLDRGDEKC